MHSKYRMCIQFIGGLQYVISLWKNCGKSSAYRRHIRGILSIEDLWMVFQLQKTIKGLLSVEKIVEGILSMESLWKTLSLWKIC